MKQEITQIFEQTLSSLFRFLGLGLEISKTLSASLIILCGVMIATWVIKELLLKRLKQIMENAIADRNLKPEFDYLTIKGLRDIFISTRYARINPNRYYDPYQAYKYDEPANLISFMIKKSFNEKISNDKFYLILADAGMGKTAFMVNLYMTYNSIFNFRKKHKMRLLRFQKPDYNNTNVDIIERIKKIEDRKNTILLLDGLDEDSFIVSQDPAISEDKAFEKRINEIVNETVEFCNVVITCRSQYFPQQELQDYDLNIRNPSGGFHKLNKYYIFPFSNTEIKKYLDKKYGILRYWNWSQKRKAYKVVSNSHKLMSRPMMMSYINDLVIDEKDYRFSYEVYETLIDKWLIRESSKFKRNDEREGFIKSLYAFSREVALYIYRKQKADGVLHISKDETLQIAEKYKIELKPGEVKGKSLLTCDPLLNWKFVHKSILEYFLALELVKNKDFKSDFNYTGFQLAEIFYAELSENYNPSKSEIKDIDKVFGVSNKTIGSYIERKHIDKMFLQSVNSQKHVVVYGSSKQGKTALLMNNFTQGKYTACGCSPNTELVDIYKTILRKNDITIIHTIDETNSNTSTMASSLKAKIEIPIFTDVSANISVSTKNSNIQSVKRKTFEYNIALPQDIIEILKKIHFQKPIVLENFHYLSIEVQKQLAFDLRTFQDENINFIILGIWRDKNRLSQYNGDLLDRVVEIPVEPWQESEFIKIIQKGSSPDFLNVTMERKLVNYIINSSFGSVGVLQELCKYSCHSAEKRVDQKLGDMVIDISMADVKTAINTKVQEYSGRYIRSFEAFILNNKTEIPYYMIKLLLSIDTDIARSGFTKQYIEKNFYDLGCKSLSLKQDIVSFLSKIKQFQDIKEISPPIFDYDISIMKVFIIDSTLYFFLKYCNRRKILEHIADILGIAE